MNQTLEAWKQIPDVSDEVSQTQRSESFAKGIRVFVGLEFNEGYPSRKGERKVDDQ